MNAHFMLHYLCNNFPLMDNRFPNEKSFPIYCSASVDFHKAFHLHSYRRKGPELAEAISAPESPPNLNGHRGSEWHRSTRQRFLAAPSTIRSISLPLRSAP